MRRLAVLPALLSVCALGCSPGKPPAAPGPSSGGPATEAAPEPAKPGEAAPVEAADAKAHVEGGKPVGLFFMTRYANHQLEKAAWYFTPDGKVFQNLEQGLTAADLAAHQGRHGTFTADGKVLDVTWSDGSKLKSAMEPDEKNPNLFMWDMGIFSPAERFDEYYSPAGRYEGGESLSHGGNAAIVSKSLTLGADGTFTWEGVSFLQGTTETSRLAAGASGATTGTWKLDGFTIALSASDGKTLRMLAFPFDDKQTELKPDWMFFGGMVYKKK
ncbi:MAG: hypothetical protein KIS92_21780 [Planctomycetota bacterium]|nr:hypothetical protein [Planctomycetota bacterium]